MEVANADGFVFKRRRKEETSTSTHPARQKAPRVEETYHQNQNNKYHGPSVQEQEHVVEDVHQVNVGYGNNNAKDKSRRRTSSFIQEETRFPPYPVGGAIILPADGEDESLDEGEKLVKLCHEITSTECRNVSRTFVGKTEEVSHLIYNALGLFEEKVKALVQDGSIKFLSKESRELSTKKQTMQRLVESLESELKSWSEIKDKEAEEEVVVERSYAEEEEEGRKRVRGESVEGKLVSAYSNTLNKLDIKVSNLCGLVKSVESLCGQTEKYTKDLQTKYHKQTFNPLPHVNSPANLIKSLLKPTV